MTTPDPAWRGIDFVGWKTWWNYRLPRRRTLSNLATKLNSFERTTVRPALGGLARHVDLRRLDESDNGRQFYSMLASYGGHLKHGAAFKTWEEVWAKRPWLRALLERRGWSFAERWSRRALARERSFPSQYWRLARAGGNDSLVYFQVGRFIEFYGPQRLLAVRLLGLRAVALPRAGYAFRAGFPAYLFGVYVRRAIQDGLIVLQVPQLAPPLGKNCRVRLPSAILIPAGRRYLQRLGGSALG
jgi:hypothetical protein